MEMQQEVRRALKIWIALLALLTLTLSSAYLHLGIWNGVLNMAIALAKALLVAIFFMHLRDSSILPRMIAAIALFTLALLFTISSADYATRVTYRAPLQAPANTTR